MTQDDRITTLAESMTKSQDDRMTMTTLAESIRERYSETGEDEDDSGSGSQGLVFIVSVSSSPQARAGKLPPLLTLIDYNIGKNSISKIKISNIYLSKYSFHLKKCNGVILKYVIH